MTETPTRDPAKALRTASTVLLLRDGAQGMEIFMVQRHHQIEFSSGALVFPGGSMDPGDREIAADSALVPHGGGLDSEAAAIRIGGIRETFEESGIMLARPHGSGELIAAAQLAPLEPQRAALDEGKVSFADILRQHALRPAIDCLVPFAHWITPVQLPKRFDTHFLLALAPPDQVGRHDGHESVDSIWLSPKEALAGAESGRFKLPFPTIRNLIKLDRLGSAKAAMEFARKTPVVTVMPQLSKTATGLTRLQIPVEAGYDGSVFEVERP
ncbi:NUDIX hydrolase [Afipia sp. Root123D2]|uniref:NUDIX hydrolase n=1 Tax=Afipia sp. Root123D2 TaxID=1736436 RepID=UPI0007004E53|nr:NUDIX hydrolase [Afipia sp. Root123D2]KQW22628.1 NUDIX hydrolase [Afipia sp. Root123D2]